MTTKLNNIRHVKLKAGLAMVCTVCALVYGCKEKYLPEVKEVNINYLVIEGLINTGTDSTIFDLSRTFKLNNKAIEAPEKGAIVQVESEAGATYILPALIKAGKYGRPSLGLDPGKRHRLRIRTTDKREYLSDFVENRVSPPIDELKFDFQNDFLNVDANTHDPSDKSRYYRYSYIETMEYRAPLRSFWKVENHKVVERDFPADNIWTCWRTIPSNNIVLGSTMALIKDELADKAIVSVPRGSLKLRFGYSGLVKQTVLTKEGFEFFESLKKNTESVGSIFDAQPSQLFGNIRSTTDPSEIVIGFISAGTVTQKRITLKPDEMPLYWFQPPPDIDLDGMCAKTVKGLVEASIVAQHPLLTPIQRNKDSYFPPFIYDATDDINCVDCRKQGGTNVKPSYWP